MSPGTPPKCQKRKEGLKPPNPDYGKRYWGELLLGELEPILIRPPGKRKERCVHRHARMSA